MPVILFDHIGDKAVWNTRMQHKEHSCIYRREQG